MVAIERGRRPPLLNNGRRAARDTHETMIDILKEFWLFLRERKKYWLLPIVLVLGLLGGLIVLTQGSAIAPFIYTLF